MSNLVRYHLATAPAVEPGALEPLGGRQPDLDHSLAFEVLDRQLVRLAKAAGVLGLQMGKALAPMLAGGYEQVGYARVADYCIEQLGFGRRSAEQLRRQADQMDRHPAVREAFLDAVINESAARLVLNHLDSVGGDARELVELATTCTVRALKEGLDDLATRPGPEAGAEPTAPGAEPEAEPGAVFSAGVPPEVAADVAQDSADAAGERTPAAGAWRSYHLPPEWVATWDLVVEHFCRTEEVDLKSWQVLELLAADFLAGRPLDLAGPPPDFARVAQPVAAERARIDARWDHQRSGTPIDWRKMLEEVSHCWKWLPELPRVKVELDGRLGMPIPTDPHALHELLRELVACRRRLDVYLGRMLRTMADYNLARLAQYASICHYAAERLGLGASTTSRLIQRERRLIRRQRVYDAIAAGRIGLTQADLILSLPDIVPDETWIAWAEVRTCRRLEDAVRDILAACRVDREAVRLRGWHPPAEGEVLTDKLAPLGGGQAMEISTDTPAPAWEAESAQAARQSARAGDSAVAAVQLAVNWIPMFSQAGPGLRIFVPDDVLPIVFEAEEAASRIAGRHLSPEACLVAFMIGAEARYTEFERQTVARRRRALRRSRFRCAVPGCRVRRGLHVHHIVYRSHGGGDEDENLLALCPAHHLRGIHEGRLRVHARGDELDWELGIRAGKPALVFRGEVRVA